MAAKTPEKKTSTPVQREWSENEQLTIATLSSMGFDDQVAQEAVLCCGINVEKCLEWGSDKNKVGRRSPTQLLNSCSQDRAVSQCCRRAAWDGLQSLAN